MNVPWIQVYSNLLDHQKTYRLADALKLSSPLVDPNAIAAAMLIGLWTWAAQNAYTGDLSGCGARAIANACRWKKSPDTLLDALLLCGWIDSDMMLHDWREYAALFIESEEGRKEKTRERVSRYRAKKAAPEDVTKGSL